MYVIYIGNFLMIINLDWNFYSYILRIFVNNIYCGILRCLCLCEMESVKGNRNVWMEKWDDGKF